MDTVKRVNDELDDKARELEKNDQTDSAAICRKHRLSVDSMLTNYMQFVKENQESLSKTSIGESYDEFMFKEKSKLEEEFYALNDFLIICIREQFLKFSSIRYFKSIPSFELYRI